MDFNTLLNGQGQQPGGVVAPQEQAAIPQGNPAMQAPQAPSGQPPQDGGFFQKLQKDPAFAQSMIMMGSRLMQGPRYGQDEVGMWGEAALAGATTYSNQRAAAYDQQQQDQEIARKGRETDSQIDARAVTTEGARAQNTENAALAPDRLKAYRLKLDALQRVDDLEKATQGYKKLKANFIDTFANNLGSNIEKVWMAELQNPLLEAELTRREKQAGIELKGAQTGYYQTGADENMAQAENWRDRTKNPEKYAGRTGDAGATAKSLEAWKRELKVQFPEESEGEISRMATENQLAAKRQGTHAALTKFASDMGYDLSTPQGVKQVELAWKNSQDLVSRVNGEKPAGKGASPTPTKSPTGATEMPARKDRTPGMVWNGYTWSGTGWVKNGAK